ncbi:MAG: SMC-Scp complex subunit ScpB [Ferrimicrobium sp.]
MYARKVEAILLVSTSPVDPVDLGRLLALEPEALKRVVLFLQDSLVVEDRAMRLTQGAQGVQLRTAGDLEELIKEFLTEEAARPVSKAALEALAIVAYLQPISRAQVSEARGVNSDGVLRMLIARGYIRTDRQRGRPNDPALLATTELFLERFGFASLAELDPLASFVPDLAVVEGLEEALRNS